MAHGAISCAQKFSLKYGACTKSHWQNLAQNMAHAAIAYAQN